MWLHTSVFQTDQSDESKQKIPRNTSSREIQCLRGKFVGVLCLLDSLLSKFIIFLVFYNIWRRERNYLYTHQDEIAWYFVSTANWSSLHGEEETYVVKFTNVVCLYCPYLYELLVNLTDNILSFMTKVNVDFVIKGMKCHKDDEHNVRGLDTEVNKHLYSLILYSLMGISF